MKRPPMAGVPSPCIDLCRIDPAFGWCETAAPEIYTLALCGALPIAARRALLQELARRAPPPARAGAALEPLR